MKDRSAKAVMQSLWKSAVPSFLQGHELCFFPGGLTRYKLTEAIQKGLDEGGRKDLSADEWSDPTVGHQ